ncbi:hypothetical protein EIZ39_24775 [Ammoniphilus sp. CFH 90114]|nr:hypothetical protein EIZ39_24775 [Ammoniphilus sp. CFH 90114]
MELDKKAAINLKIKEQMSVWTEKPLFLIQIKDSVSASYRSKRFDTLSMETKPKLNVIDHRVMADSYESYYRIEPTFIPYLWSESRLFPALLLSCRWSGEMREFFYQIVLKIQQGYNIL